ncbi:MAG: hypothetical protein ACREKS_22995 [Candidatus Rokuibacteriota bacterium]
MIVVHEASEGRVVVLDSLSRCDERITARDVVVTGSFAGPLAFGFALEGGVRALVAHAAGVGLDGAGIAGLAFAARFALPATAVDTMSARLGDGRSVHDDGVVAFVNAEAEGLDVCAGMPASLAARRLLAAPPGRVTPGLVLVDRSQRIVRESGGRRLVLMGSTSFATAANRQDVLCVGSHGGRVNALPLLAVCPRGVIFNDGGLARDRSGIGGLRLLDEAGVAAAAVDTMTARIGDPLSTWDTGVLSAVNQTAARRRLTSGQAARVAADLMLGLPAGAP